MARRDMKRFLLAGLLALAGCAPPPEADSALGPEPRDARYPPLVPLSEVLALDRSDPEAQAEAEAEMAARTEALKAKAEALRKETP
jgi:hypothetical protein